MVRPILQIAVVLVIIMVWGTAHLLAHVIVDNGLGFIAIALLLISTPLLSRYLD